MMEIIELEFKLGLKSLKYVLFCIFQVDSNMFVVDIRLFSKEELWRYIL